MTKKNLEIHHTGNIFTPQILMTPDFGKFIQSMKNQRKSTSSASVIILKLLKLSNYSIYLIIDIIEIIDFIPIFARSICQEQDLLLSKNSNYSHFSQKTMNY